MALIFYELLKPVSVSLSLLAAFFRLMHVVIVAVNTIDHFASLVLLGGAHLLTAFQKGQLQAMALVSLSPAVAAHLFPYILLPGRNRPVQWGNANESRRL